MFVLLETVQSKVCVVVVDIISCTLVHWGTFQQLQAMLRHLLTRVQIMFPSSPQSTMYFNKIQKKTAPWPKTVGPPNQ